jgi:hypothetical protein
MQKMFSFHTLLRPSQIIYQKCFVETDERKEYRKKLRFLKIVPAHPPPLVDTVRLSAFFTSLILFFLPVCRVIEAYLS